MNIQRSIAVAVLLILSANAAAFAHAQLLPPCRQRAGMFPRLLRKYLLNFSQPLEPSFSSVVVRDSSEASRQGGFSSDAGDRKTMRVSLPPLPHGAYIVVWRALTADTHRTEGAFIFRVGE